MWTPDLALTDAASACITCAARELDPTRRPAGTAAEDPPPHPGDDDRPTHDGRRRPAARPLPGQAIRRGPADAPGARSGHGMERRAVVLVPVRGRGGRPVLWGP